MTHHLGVDDTPAEFKGRREAEIWARLCVQHQRVPANKTETFSAIVRALADEERARTELDSAVAGGDANSARIYASIVKDMRAQAAKMLLMI